jgi:hypothetical protein
MYGSGKSNEPTVDKEWMCYFHWTQFVDKHKKQQINP